MFLRKKGQSTAEYAIALGLVIAVAAGVTQVLLKGAIKDKQKQALSFLADAGKDTPESNFGTGVVNNTAVYNQEMRKTTLDHAAFVDESLVEKGGSEKHKQVQASSTGLVSVETINASAQGE